MKDNCVLSPYGVVIKKCCASCAHKELGKNEEQRICMKGEGEVPKNYLCEDWEMAENLKKIKLVERGHVKKPHYIAWQKKELSRIAESVQNTKEKVLALTTMPERYEDEFGSRYM